MRTLLAVCGLGIAALIAGGCNLQAGLPSSSQNGGGSDPNTVKLPTAGGMETAPISGIRYLKVYFYSNDRRGEFSGQDAQARLARITLSSPDFSGSRHAIGLPEGTIEIQFEVSNSPEKSDLYIMNDAKGQFVQDMNLSNVQYNVTAPLDSGWID